MIKVQYKEIAKKILYYGGYYSLHERLHAPSEHRLLILMFHNVVADRDQRSHWLLRETPTESQFEAVLVALKKQYRVISVENAACEMRDAGKLKERSVAITFDDAYAPTYSVVFPLLKRYDVTATVYLPTDWIDRGIAPWWLTVAGMIDQCDLTASLIARIEEIVGKSVELNASSPGDPAAAKWNLLASLQMDMMRRDEKIQNQIIEQLGSFLPDDRGSLSRLAEPMNWEQIREMSDHGIRFGAHTCSHVNLSHVTLDAAECEIVESKRIIEDRVGVEITGFAYPYGYDVAGYRRLKPMLEKNGFSYACTSWPGHVDTGTDFYLLPRIGLPNTSSPAVIARALSLDYCMKSECSTMMNDT